jgi:type I site-specific restriction endonuclease
MKRFIESAAREQLALLPEYLDDYVDAEPPVYVANERMQYLGPDGKLITGSLRDFTRITIGKCLVSLDAFLQAWSDADKKQAIVGELEQHGILFDELAREIGEDLAFSHRDQLGVTLAAVYG